MPNNINGINSGRNQPANDRQVTSARPESQNQTGVVSGSNSQTDTVSLTDMASRLKSLEQKLASQSDVDQSHVNRVRDALSRGEYQINPDRVADKMIDFEADF